MHFNVNKISHATVQKINEQNLFVSLRTRQHVAVTYEHVRRAIVRNVRAFSRGFTTIEIKKESARTALQHNCFSTFQTVTTTVNVNFQISLAHATEWNTLAWNARNEVFIYLFIYLRKRIIISFVGIIKENETWNGGYEKSTRMVYVKSTVECESSRSFEILRTCFHLSNALNLWTVITRLTARVHFKIFFRKRRIL